MIEIDISLLTAWVWGALILVLSVFSAGHALLNKRDPRAAIGWIAVCLFVPIAGAFAYFLLGVNRAHRRARKLKSIVSSDLEARFQVLGDDPVGVVPEPLGGNRVTEYLSGPTAYEAMLDAIAGASQRVWLSQYIFEKRGVGARFISALSAAAARGVDVHVLLDGVGAWYAFGSTRRALTRGGVAVAMFAPPRLVPFQWSANLRNHRKILVVDDRVAFTGGMNIRSSYIASEPDGEPRTKDCHFRFDGPIVPGIAAVFRDDWYATTGELLGAPAASPGSVGTAHCRVTVDGPDNRVDLLTLILQTAISSARRRVRLMTPYFLPPKEIVSALQAASLRGVTVEVILPGKNNLPFVHWATRHLLRLLLPYGVRVFYQQGHFDHSKLARVDDDFSLVGSANIDPRSLRLNFEIGVEVWCRDLAAQLDDHIEARLAEAEPLEEATLSRAHLTVRLRDAFFCLFMPYL